MIWVGSFKSPAVDAPQTSFHGCTARGAHLGGGVQSEIGQISPLSGLVDEPDRGISLVRERRVR